MCCWLCQQGSGTLFFFQLLSAAWPQSPPCVTSSPVSFEGQQHHLFERKRKANTVPRFCWNRQGHRSPALRCASICKGEAGSTSIAHAPRKPKKHPQSISYQQGVQVPANVASCSLALCYNSIVGSLSFPSPIFQAIHLDLPMELQQVYE